jgi:hypothetical protein
LQLYFFLQFLLLETLDTEPDPDSVEMLDPEAQHCLLLVVFSLKVNAYLILIVQFLVSVGASFMFGYLAPYYVSGLTEVGPRLLIGVLVAFVVGIADLYFVIRQMLDDDGIRLAKKVD